MMTQYRSPSRRRLLSRRSLFSFGVAASMVSASLHANARFLRAGQNNDQWDFDWAFERQIVRLPLFG
jgi:hypothetical protein